MSTKTISLLVVSALAVTGCMSTNPSNQRTPGEFQVVAQKVIPAGVPCLRIQERYRKSVSGCDVAVVSASGGMTREQLIDLNVKFQREVVHFVNFDFDKDVLRPDARRTLDQQAAWIREYADLKFSVFGHTDLVGSQDYNFDLAKRRADAVVNYLISQGVSVEQLESVVSFGKTQPIVQTTRPEERNRRAVTEVSGYLRVNSVSLVPISCGMLDSAYLPTYSYCISEGSLSPSLAATVVDETVPPRDGDGSDLPPRGPTRNLEAIYGDGGESGVADPEMRGQASLTDDGLGNIVTQASGETGPVEAPRTSTFARSESSGGTSTTSTARAGDISVTRTRNSDGTYTTSFTGFPGDN